MIPLEEARRHVLDACPRLPVTTVALGESLGHVTAADLAAAEDVPPFDNSAVDGYAVRVADVADPPVELEVAGTIAAGAPPSIPVEPGRGSAHHDGSAAAGRARRRSSWSRTPRR